MTNLKGYGYGSSNKGPVTFTYGMTPKEASKYLMNPFPELEKIYKDQREREKKKKEQST